MTGSEMISIWIIVDLLRREEGNSVMIFCDNPGGPPYYAIEVCAEWTNWEPRRFESNLSVLDALDQANRARPQ